MKYRIKDPDVVKAFKILGWAYEFDEANVERFGFWWPGKFRGKIFFDPHEEFDVEPVPKVVDGWHPYPADKPDKVGIYLVAYEGDGEKGVEAERWNGEYFFPAMDDVIAWREFPEYW